MKVAFEGEIPLQPVRWGRRADGGGSGGGYRRPGTAACTRGWGVLAAYSGRGPSSRDEPSGSRRSAAAPLSCPAYRSLLAGCSFRCILAELLAITTSRLTPALEASLGRLGPMTA